MFSVATFPPIARRKINNKCHLLPEGSTLKVLNEMLKPFNSRVLSDLNAREILFPEEV